MDFILVQITWFFVFVCLAVFYILKTKANELKRQIKELKSDLDLEKKKFEEHTRELDVLSSDKNKELQDKITELEKLNKFMVGRELKMIELKEEIKNLNIALAKTLKPKRINKTSMKDGN